MLKKLDAFHLINRVGRQMNSEHPRKGNLISQLSQCIFTSSQEDTAALESARQEGNIANLSTSQKKSERGKFVRRVIQDPKKIVAKILLLLKKEITFDRQAIAQHRQSGDPCVDISTAHPAYPLITKKVMKCIIRQRIGCVHDEQSETIDTVAVGYRCC